MFRKLSEAPPSSVNRLALTELLRQASVPQTRPSLSTSLLAELMRPRAPPTVLNEYDLLAALAVNESLMNSRPLSLSLTSSALSDPLVSSRLALLDSLPREDPALSAAFQRGREEALASLARSGVLEARLPSRAAVADHAEDPHYSFAPKDPNAAVLEALGTTGIERRRKNVPYFDASSLQDPDPDTVTGRRTRGGVVEPFPEKLHRMLNDCVEKGEEDIISFFPHGRAFAIHHPERFAREVMPRYFKQSRLSSFQRQLNLYGFNRIASGPDAGGYYHELFLRGRPSLSIHMRRVGVSKPTNHRNDMYRTSYKPDPSAAPDFYAMPPVKATQKEHKGEKGTAEE